MEEFKTDFLKQEVLGRKVNFSNTGSVIQGCITKADRDMLSGGRFAVKKFKIKTQKAHVDWLQEEFEFFSPTILHQAVCSSGGMVYNSCNTKFEWNFYLVKERYNGHN